METYRLIARVGSDGILKLEFPTDTPDRELEILVVTQPIVETAVDALGWPVGFFERTYGALADMPIDRGADLPPDVRDDIE